MLLGNVINILSALFFKCAQFLVINLMHCDDFVICLFKENGFVQELTWRDRAGSLCKSGKSALWWRRYLTFGTPQKEG